MGSIVEKNMFQLDGSLLKDPVFLFGDYCRCNVYYVHPDLWRKNGSNWTAARCRNPEQPWRKLHLDFDLSRKTTVLNNMKEPKNRPWWVLFKGKPFPFTIKKNISRRCFSKKVVSINLSTSWDEIELVHLGWWKSFSSPVCTVWKKSRCGSREAGVGFGEGWYAWTKTKPIFGSHSNVTSFQKEWKKVLNTSSFVFFGLWLLEWGLEFLLLDPVLHMVSDFDGMDWMVLSYFDEGGDGVRMRKTRRDQHFTSVSMSRNLIDSNE